MITLQLPMDSTDITWPQLPQGSTVLDDDGDTWHLTPSGWHLLSHGAAVSGYGHPVPPASYAPYTLLVPLPITTQDILTALEGADDE